MGKEERKMERREQEYWGEWSDALKFLYFASDAEVKAYLEGELAKSASDNILVVGGVKLFEGETREIAGRKLVVNHAYSLEWLADACDAARTSDDRTIVVSNYPRDYDPPRVRYVQAGMLFAKAEMGGMVEEASCPYDTSLQLLRPDDGRTLGIFFVHTYAAGYLNSVLLSQGYPRVSPMDTQVLASGDEVSVPAEEHAKLVAETDKTKREEMLRRVAADMELVGERDHRMKETVFWSGEVLGP